jgi:nucleotide-binding universal stress UspA family protein
MAADVGHELLFLYVVDIEFVAHTERAIRPDVIDKEMEKLGEFLLEMARVRAKEQGVEAQVTHRHGSLKEELIAAAAEHEVDTIVMGRPSEDGAGSVADLESFAAQVQAETGAEVLIL